MLGAFGSRHGHMLAFKVLVLALKANTADTAPKGSRLLRNLGTRTCHLQQGDHRNDVKVSEILEDWVALTRDVNKWGRRGSRSCADWDVPQSQSSFPGPVFSNANERQI
jgi:hypothetical protein